MENSPGYVENQAERKRTHLTRTLAVLTAAIYAIVWSFISVDKYYSLNASVWDLGYMSNLFHSLIVYHWTVDRLISQLATQGLAILIAPISLLNSIPALLVFQSIMLGLPAYLLFEIGLHETRDRNVSLLFSLIYFFYFPVSGINWFDFHIQALFIPFFLLGYLLFLKGHYYLSMIVFALSTMVRFPYVVLVVVSSIVLCLPAMNSLLRKGRTSLKSEEKFLIALVCVSVFLLLFQYLWIMGTNPGFIVTHSSSNHNPLTNTYSKLMVVLLLLAPLIFLPLLSKKWILPILLFLGAVFILNNSIYEFPDLFTNQYSAPVIPFLFLGTIDVVSKIGEWKRKTGTNRFVRVATSLRISSLISPKILTLGVTMVLVCMSVFVEPFGPLNDYSYDRFNLNLVTQSHSGNYNAVENIISLIPENATYVVVQNDLPQFFSGRALPDVMVPPYNIGPNITSQEISKNLFPLKEASRTSFVPIDYVIADINDIHTFNQLAGIPGFPSMFQLDRILLKSGHYGIKAEDNGVILLERGFTGNTDVIAPYAYNVDFQNLVLKGPIFNNGFPVINGSSTSAELMTPLLYMFPGIFIINITAIFDVNSDSSVSVYAGNYTSTTTFTVLNDTKWNITPYTGTESQYIQVGISFSNFVSNAQCYFVPSDLNGRMTVESITINQFS